MAGGLASGVSWRSGRASSLHAHQSETCVVGINARMRVPCAVGSYPMPALAHRRRAPPAPRPSVGNRQQHSIKHIEEQRRQQQQEAREAFAAAELDYECAAFA